MLPQRVTANRWLSRVPRLPVLDYLPGRGCPWHRRNDWGSWDRQVLPVLITIALMKWYLTPSSNKTLKEVFRVP